MDIEKNAPSIIVRVLESGRQEDWLELLNHYDLQRIQQAMTQERWLVPFTRSFLSKFLGVSENEFRSYHFQKAHPEVYFWAGVVEGLETDRSNLDRWPLYEDICRSIARVTSSIYPS